VNPSTDHNNAINNNTRPSFRARDVRFLFAKCRHLSVLRFLLITDYKYDVTLKIRHDTKIDNIATNLYPKFNYYDRLRNEEVNANLYQTLPRHTPLPVGWEYSIVHKTWHCGNLLSIITINVYKLFFIFL